MLMFHTTLCKPQTCTLIFELQKGLTAEYFAFKSNPPIVQSNDKGLFNPVRWRYRLVVVPQRNIEGLVQFFQRGEVLR